MHYRKKHKSKGGVLVLGTLIVFLLVLAVLVVGTTNLYNATCEEGVVATKQAIERAAVLCYATEGFYPPGLDYIEKNYGVQVDHDRYAVRYEAQASNIMPIIRVMPH